MGARWRAFVAGLKGLFSSWAGKVLAIALAVAALIPLFQFIVDLGTRYKDTEEIPSLNERLKGIEEPLKKAGGLESLLSQLEAQRTMTLKCRDQLIDLLELFGSHIEDLEGKKPTKVDSGLSRYTVAENIFILRCECYGGVVNLGKLYCDGLLDKPPSFDPQYRAKVP
jgi:hypothetical protein